MRIAEVATYFNPFDTSFERYSFQELSLEHKVATLFFAVIGVAFFGIGALASYRFCLKQFSVIAPASPAEAPQPPLRAQTSESRSEAFGRAIKEGRIPKSAKRLTNVSLKTLLCKERLSSFLLRTREKFGVAVDDGDCFYDAFRQGLKTVLVTVKELRTIVHKKMQALHQKHGINNWVFRALKTDTGTQQHDYEELLEQVARTKEEIGVPLWGRTHIEGRILADHFKAKIEICEVNTIDTILLLRQVRGVTDVETGMVYDLVQKVEGGVRAVKVCEPVWKQICPRSKPIATTVKMAGYPGHFVPVMALG